MKIKALFTFVLLSLSLHSKAQGLEFQSTANSIEERTSYEVFNRNKVEFKHMLRIQFKMRLPLREDVGYVIRIMDEQHKQIFNVFYDGRGNDYMELNEEGHKSLLKYNFNRKSLRKRQWFDMLLDFNLDKKEITFSVDGHKQTVAKGDLPKNMSPRIFFGRSDYLIDVPTFAMKDLVISDGNNVFDFPLRQASGNDVFTRSGKKMGHVHNPYWVINDNFHWKRIFASRSSVPAGCSYYAGKHQVLFYNNSTLSIYNIMSQQVQRVKFAIPCPVILYLGTNFIDEQSGRLYTYELYREGKKDGEASVASFDLTDYRWSFESTTQVNEGQMHHHGAFFDPQKQEYTIYGGFANMRYNSTYYTYRINQHSWQMHHDIRGEHFPRYFLSMGYDGNRYVYSFGGMGNESGDQTVGRRFFYDLHRLDTKTNKVVRLWDTNWDGQQNSVFVKGMVIKGNYFYTLGYSEFLSDSFLKLYRFSIKDGSYCQLGDSIPIHPDRIETDANLYYDGLLHKFIATVQEFKDEKNSVFHAYTIDDPVLSEQAFQTASAVPRTMWPWYILIAILVSLAIFIVYNRYWYKKRKDDSVWDLTVDVFQTVHDSLYLFGDFQAFDSKGRDMTFMFTDKLRQIVCLFLQYGPDGIPSRRLGNMVWGDKSPEKIKNSRSVAINHLRKVFTEMSGVEIIYQNNNLVMKTQSPFYCDYLRLMELILSKDYLENGREEFLSIVNRGKFLSFTDNPSLDSFKSSTEEQILIILRDILHHAGNENNIPVILSCVKCIFNIDPVDEDSYQIQIKTLKKIGHNLDVVEAQLRFKNAYKEYYGRDYSR